MRQYVATAATSINLLPNLVTRLLKLPCCLMQTSTMQAEIPAFTGLSDKDLFREILKEAGERSAVFAIQSISSARYKDNSPCIF
jgi:hypothetical protein